MPTLLRAPHLIADPDLLESSVIQNGALVIDKGVVVAAGTWQELEVPYGGLEPLKLPEHSLIIPGLVNAHHHGRGLSTLHVGMVDKPLELWLPEFTLYPALDPYLDTLYTATRMLKSGVTTSLQSHSSPGPFEDYERGVYRSLEAYREAGVRVAFAIGLYDQNFLTHADETLFKTLPKDLQTKVSSYFAATYIDTNKYFSLFETLFHDTQHDAKINLFLSPCGLHWASREIQQRMARTAKKHQTGVHLHLLETSYQRDYAKQTFGKSAVNVLHDNGLLGEHVSLAHGIHVTSEDNELLAVTNTLVVTNPSSNLRLGSGLLPFHNLQEAGVNVALGMDSMTLFGDDDMLSEMTLLQTLHRHHDGRWLSPYQALQMATVNGATASRFKIGKLLPGYHADITVIDLEPFQTPFLQPNVDVIALALSQGKARDVDTVLVGGEVLVKNKGLTNLNLEAIGAGIRESLEIAINLEDHKKKLEFLRDLEPHLISFYKTLYPNESREEP
jgi:5-methylthioadenosine/S-adenosylhomocysteine deaminase